MEINIKEGSVFLMTKIDIFSGFLGAGKTTLIKKLIAEAYSGEKLVRETHRSSRPGSMKLRTISLTRERGWR